MKTYKILNSEDSGILTFTIDGNKYKLSVQYTDELTLDLVEAEDTENGLVFTDEINKDMDYAEADYLRLFLNLISRFDNKLFDSYIILEPIGQI